jgi:hypothetical protein
MRRSSSDRPSLHLYRDLRSDSSSATFAASVIEDEERHEQDPDHRRGDRRSELGNVLMHEHVFIRTPELHATTDGAAPAVPAEA